MGQQHPQWAANRTGQMCHAGVDADHQIQAGTQGRRVSKILFWPLQDAMAVLASQQGGIFIANIFLYHHIVGPGWQDGEQLSQRQTTLMVIAVLGIPAPGQANSRA